MMPSSSVSLHPGGTYAASPSGSGNFYPGSNFGASPSGSGNFYAGSNCAGSPSGSVRAGSRGSASSSISVESARATVSLVERSQSLESLARQISRDLNDLDDTVRQLNAWFRSLDPKGYTKRTPWSAGMESAYDRYKRYGAAHAQAHTAFQICLSTTKRNTTPDQHAERAKLAIDWGTQALRYVYLGYHFPYPFKLHL